MSRNSVAKVWELTGLVSVEPSVVLFSLTELDGPLNNFLFKSSLFVKAVSTRKFGVAAYVVACSRSWNNLVAWWLDEVQL